MLTVTVAKNRLAVIYKSLATAAFVAAALYVSYPLVPASCCYVSIIEKTPHTELCCAETITDSDCCADENPLKNENFLSGGLFGETIHRNDMCGLQKFLSGNSFAELSGIDGEKRIHPNKTTYFIFKPPQA